MVGLVSIFNLDSIIWNTQRQLNAYKYDLGISMIGLEF